MWGQTTVERSHLSYGSACTLQNEPRRPVGMAAPAEETPLVGKRDWVVVGCRRGGMGPWRRVSQILLDATIYLRVLHREPAQRAPPALRWSAHYPGLGEQRHRPC